MAAWPNGHWLSVHSHQFSVFKIRRRLQQLHGCWICKPFVGRWAIKLIRWIRNIHRLRGKVDRMLQFHKRWMLIQSGFFGWILDAEGCWLNLRVVVGLLRLDGETE